MISALLISRPLWLSARVYPFTPVISWWKPFPHPLDTVVFGVMLGALASSLFWPRGGVVAFAVIAISLAMADQSRWQPWFYQYSFLLLAAAMGNPRAARLILAATYFWSGAQKLSGDFLRDTFPAMVDPFVQAHPALGPLLRAVGSVAPVVEIAIGLALLWPRTRKAAVVAAVSMHTLILLAIGPFGANVNPVVWPWNLAMIALAPAVFWSASDTPREILWPARSPFHRFALLLFAIMPALSFFNLWDAYLSAALYSANKNTAVIRMSDSLADRLPDDVQEHITVEAGYDELDLNEWSFDTLRVPAYPEIRIFRRVADWVCGYARPGEAVTLLIDRRRPPLAAPRQEHSTCSADVRQRPNSASQQIP